MDEHQYPYWQISQFSFALGSYNSYVLFVIGIVLENPILQVHLKFKSNACFQIVSVPKNIASYS